MVIFNSRIHYKEFINFQKRLKIKWFKYARDTFWGDGVDSRFLAAFLLKSYKNKRMLDIGCSKGVILSEIDRIDQKFGLDLSDEFLKIARILNKDTGFVQADMHSLPFKNSSFDLICFLGMIEIPLPKNKTECISEISRVLINDGELIMTTPNKKVLAGKHRNNHIDYNTLKQLLNKDFIFEIFGFNPFTKFPYFLPNFILQNFPFIWRILFFVMEKKILLNRCRSFLVIARKKAH